MSAGKEWSGVTTPEQARQHIERLVWRFARNLDVYTRADYKETQVRVEFIDPFFEALGWDVCNVRGYAEQYKDVVHEDAIKVSGATRAPDYCFRVGRAHLFVEPATLASIAIPADKKLYQQQIEVTHRDIDALVYELYGLTEEEIASVERPDH